MLWKGKIHMKKLSTIALAVVLVSLSYLYTPAFARNTDFTDDQIVNAIGKAENSKRFPYGIKSINTHGDPVMARRICLNSVRNGRRRWLAACARGDLIAFIGERFSPPASNPNWVRLVHYFLARAK